MQQDYKFKQKPKFSTDSKEVTLLVEDFQDIMEIVHHANKESPIPGKSTPTQATTNDKVTVQQTPRPRCPNGPDTYLATPRPRYRPKITEADVLNPDAPVYDQVEPGIFETYMDERKSDKVAAEFHQACDNIPNTLVIIKSGQYIAGGYTEVAWSSPSQKASHKPSKLTFLFSVNRQKTYSVTDENYAVFHYVDRGPSFGCYGQGLEVYNDITQEEGGYSHLDSFDVTDVANRKTELMGGYSFKVDEYEVYKLE